MQTHNIKIQDFILSHPSRRKVEITSASLRNGDGSGGRGYSGGSPRPEKLHGVPCPGNGPSLMERQHATDATEASPPDRKPGRYSHHS
jgi:hypothetical protein